MDPSKVCAKCLEMGRQLLDKGRLASAYNKVVRASRYATTNGQKSQVGQLMSQVAKAAEGKLEEADQKYEQGEYVEALRAYKIVANIRKLPIAATARARLAKAEKDPARRNSLLEARAAPQFEKVKDIQSRLSRACQNDSNPSTEFEFDIVLAALDGEVEDCSGCEDCQAWAALTSQQREARILADRIDMAWALARIVKGYGNTPTGIKSARLLEGILVDEQFAREVDQDRLEQQARNTYAMAVNYRKNGIDKVAAKLLRKLLDQYGDSQWAQKARDDLKTDTELSILVAGVRSEKSPADRDSVAAQMQARARAILARAGQKTADAVASVTTEPQDGYGRLIKLLGPTLVNVSQQKVPTASLKNKQRILLYYSASWCGPCNVFTPKLKQFYDANKTDDNFEVILVSSDATAEDMRRYMANHRMSWLAVPMDKIEASGGSIINEYKAEALPCLVLIDSSGKVLASSVVDERYVGPDNVLSYLKASMKTERLEKTQARVWRSDRLSESNTSSQLH